MKFYSLFLQRLTDSELQLHQTEISDLSVSCGSNSPLGKGYTVKTCIHGGHSFIPGAPYNVVQTDRVKLWKEEAALSVTLTLRSNKPGRSLHVSHSDAANWPTVWLKLRHITSWHRRGRVLFDFTHIDCFPKTTTWWQSGQTTNSSWFHFQTDWLGKHW